MSKHSPSPQAAVEALFQSAVKFHQAGELARAEHLYREVLRQSPHNAAALNMLGVVGCQTGNFAAGGELIKRALQLEPKNAEFHNNLGMSLLQVGNTEAAIASFAAAVSCKGRFPEAHFNLGNALVATRALDDAEKHYRAALRQRPDYVDALNNLGNLLRQRGELEEAVKLLRKVVREQTQFAPGYLNLGLALQGLARYEEAQAAYRSALEIDDSDAGLWDRLAHCQRQRGALGDAESTLRQALATGSDSIARLNALGLVLYAQNRVSEALEVFERSAALDAGHAQTLNYLGMCFAALGDAARAVSHYERALEAAPQFGEALKNLADASGLAGDAPALIERVENLVAHADLAETDRVDMQFALGKLYDESGRYDEAFAAYTAANAVKHRQVRFNATAQARFIDALIEVFSPAFFAERTLGSDDERPVFIVGMPRSGTTLVEQILASHRDVYGAGELTFFPEHVPALAQRLGSERTFPHCVREAPDRLAELGPMYLDLIGQRGGGARRVSDKMPYNFLYLGVIAMLFPRARVVHCRRNPLAVCWSIYTHDLTGSHPYAYDLDDLAAAYRGYARLMTHWRDALPLTLLEIDYETLVRDLEGEARRLITGLGLAWDDACLSYYDTPRAVTTASYWQVRQPIFRHGVERWRAYEAQLQGLKRALADELEPR